MVRPFEQSTEDLHVIETESARAIQTRRFHAIGMCAAFLKCGVCAVTDSGLRLHDTWLLKQPRRGHRLESQPFEAVEDLPTCGLYFLASSDSTHPISNITTRSLAADRLTPWQRCSRPGRVGTLLVQARIVMRWLWGVAGQSTFQGASLASIAEGRQRGTPEGWLSPKKY